MNCPFCNFPNELNAPFCVNCGAALPPQQQAQQPQQPTGAVPEAPPPEQPQPQPPSGTGYDQQPPAAVQPPAQPVVTGAAGTPPSPEVPVISQQQVQPYPPASYQAQAPAAQMQSAVAQAQAAGNIQTPVKKKSSKGCIIAVVIITVLFIVIALVGVFGYFCFSQEKAMVQEKADKAEQEKKKKAEITVKKKKKTGKKKSGEKEKPEKEKKTKETKEAPEPHKDDGKNPILAKTPLDKLYQSQIFRQNDKINYAGATFSMQANVNVYSQSRAPSGVKLKKGMLMADVAIIVYGKAKLKKFRVALIDGKGKKNKPDNKIEKKMEMPDKQGENHKLWKKSPKVKKKKTLYLHRGFSITEEGAQNLIVEIKNLNIDRALWIEVDHDLFSK